MRIAAKGFACIILTALVTLSPALGCGRRASHTRAPASPVEEGPSIPLPEWAPENPSPEFLRAARVLRPMPREMLEQAAEGQQAMDVFLRQLTQTWTATYGLFGSMDDQIERFREAKRVYIPVASMTREQRAALDRWFEVWQTAMGGGTPPGAEFLGDYLVFLYKQGAMEDLSNVEVGVDVPEGMAVHLRFRVRQRDGSLNTPGITFEFYG